jgi:hypothetical protein
MFMTLGHCAVLVHTTQAEDIRPPVFAGRFYPSDATALKAQLKAYTLQSRRDPQNIPLGGPLRALVLPHAGYVYSGPVAVHADRVLQAGQFRRVIVLAPDHRVGFRNAMISAVAAYETPLGLIPLDPEVDRLRAREDLFGSSSASDHSEHALEVVLPYLQYYLQTPFTLIPVVLGPCDPDRMADALAPLLTPDTLLVISSDLSHYLSYEEARRRDRASLDMIIGGERRRLRERENWACGKYPLQVLLTLAHRQGWRAQLLHYANSGDTAGDRQRVVGYATLAFFADDTAAVPTRLLTRVQGQALVGLARQAIAKTLTANSDPRQETVVDLVAPCYDRHCGTFVTLEIDGVLRGCIGSLEGRTALRSSVPHNARQAAFGDPRFPPLQAHELPRVRISVSVLTPPQRLVYRGPDQLLERLVPRQDGVIIRQGFAQATYLPQVWEQLPEPVQFLSSLCRKAGLAPDAWRHGPLEVHTYRAQVFHEAR